MQSTQTAYRVMGIFSAALGVVSVAMGLFFGFGAVIIGVLGLLFGIGEYGWYSTLREQLINLLMHILPGLGAAAFAVVLLVIGVFLLWAAWAAWRRASLLQ